MNKIYIFTLTILFSGGLMAQNAKLQKPTLKLSEHKAPATIESVRPSGVTEEFRKAEINNNQERMVVNQTENSGNVQAKSKTIISRSEFENQTERGQEYILAHPELFIVEDK
jgi:hypothetical protein